MGISKNTVGWRRGIQSGGTRGAEEKRYASETSYCPYGKRDTCADDIVLLDTMSTLAAEQRRSTRHAHSQTSLGLRRPNPPNDIPCQPCVRLTVRSGVNGVMDVLTDRLGLGSRVFAS